MPMNDGQGVPDLRREGALGASGPLHPLLYRGLWLRRGTLPGGKGGKAVSKEGKKPSAEDEVDGNAELAEVWLPSGGPGRRTNGQSPTTRVVGVVVAARSNAAHAKWL